LLPPPSPLHRQLIYPKSSVAGNSLPSSLFFSFLCLHAERALCTFLQQAK
jgi:hypothetical protein